MDRTIELSEQILKTLKKDEAMSFEKLVELLNIDEIEEISMLAEELVKLQKQYKIMVTRKGNYQIFDDPKVKIGRLELKARKDDKGAFGFVVVEDMPKDIFVNGRYLGGALDGEIVRVELFGKKKEKPEGKIVEILESKSTENLVGEVAFNEKGKPFVILDDKRINLRPKILKSDLKIVPGHKVLIKLNRHKNDRKVTAEIVKVIGHKNEPGVDVLSIAYAHGFKTEWSKEAMDEINRTPETINPEEIAKRKDLRKEIIFTIDGDDTKDIDDAVSAKVLDNGNYKVGVHIADVSHYVKYGMNLEKEAYARATSVYMTNTVIPMLPPELSNGICSLNPNVDRLAMTCEMEINSKGEVVNSEIFPSVIRSRKQMTYKNVNLILEKNTTPEDYKEFEEQIKLLDEIALCLRKAKIKRGMLEFSSKEVKFKFDENNKPIEIIKREQRAGEKLIEDLMIVANETVATQMRDIDYPSIYRIHETPDEEKVSELIGIIEGLGMNVPKNQKYNLYPEAFQKLMNIVKADEKIYKLISPLALRTQRKALYAPYNEGHFGLGSKCYTHFTSPIRRFPDLKLHSLIKMALVDGEYNSKKLKEVSNQLIEICKHSSTMEKEAERCEREADDMKMAELMEDHIGEVFMGTITGVMPDALFVEASNYAEGRLHISEFNEEFDFNSELYRWEAKNNNKTYSFGDEIEIVVLAASKETRRIDFGIPKKENEEIN